MEFCQKVHPSAFIAFNYHCKTTKQMSSLLPSFYKMVIECIFIYLLIFICSSDVALKSWSQWQAKNLKGIKVVTFWEGVCYISPTAVNPLNAWTQNVHLGRNISDLRVICKEQLPLWNCEHQQMFCLPHFLSWLIPCERNTPWNGPIQIWFFWP